MSILVRSLPLLIAALIVIGTTPPSASANVGLSIAPTSLTANIDPGTTYTNVVLLTNTDTSPVKMKVFPRAFRALETDDKDATVEFSDKIPLPPADRYKLVFSPETFTLEPNETREVSLTITTSRSTAGGGYYVGAVFQTVPDTAPKAAVGQTIVNEISMPILTQVSGNLDTSAEIVSFATNKPTYSRSPVKFELRMKNTGNTHFPAIGRVDIFSDDGTKLDSVTFKGDNIIPNDTRKTTIEWKKRSLPLGKKRAVVNVYWGEQKYEAETTFEVLPGSFGSVAGSSFLWIGGLVLLFFLLSRRKKKRRKAHRR